MRHPACLRYAARFRLLSLTLMIGLLASVLPAAYAQDAGASCTPGADFTAQGASSLSAADYPAAIRHYSCAIAADNRNFAAYTGRVRAALYGGQYDLAVADANMIKDYDRALFDSTLIEADLAVSASPGDVQALMFRALLLWADARDEDALPDYDAILMIDPNNAFGYLFRGSSLQYLGDILQPPDDFADAIDSDPENADIYALIGSTYTQTGEYDTALTYLGQALQRNPEHTRSYYFRGLVYLETAQFKQAEDDFTRAIELDPAFTDPYFDRGRAYAQQGDFTGAVADFSRAISLNDQYRLAYLSRGVVYGQLGQIAEASADLARYAELNEVSGQTGDLLPDLPAQAQMSDGVVVRYPVSLNAGETISFRATSPNNRVDPLLVLLDPGGQPAAANDDEVLGQFVSAFQYTAASAGTYTLLLTHSDGNPRGPVEVTMHIGA